MNPTAAPVPRSPDAIGPPAPKGASPDRWMKPDGRLPDIRQHRASRILQLHGSIGISAGAPATSPERPLSCPHPRPPLPDEDAALAPKIMVRCNRASASNSVFFGRLSGQVRNSSHRHAGAVDFAADGSYHRSGRGGWLESIRPRGDPAGWRELPGHSRDDNQHDRPQEPCSQGCLPSSLGVGGNGHPVPDGCIGSPRTTLPARLGRSAGSRLESQRAR